MKPTKVTLQYMKDRYAQNFPKLLDSDESAFFNAMIDDVYTMFAGVGELWNHLQWNIYVEKTHMCYALLVAWYITDLHPHLAVGVITSGGIPVQRKKIGDVDIEFVKDNKIRALDAYKDHLESLKSNPFGHKAYQMIKSSGKMILYRSRK